MDNQVFKTSTGWIITYKPYLTYGQSIDLQKYMTQGSTVSAGVVSGVASDKAIESILMTMDFIIVKIEKGNGESAETNFSEVLKELPAKDGVAFQTIVLKIITESIGGDTTQKKTTIS